MLRRELEEFGYVAESEAPVLPGRPALLAATASDISWRIPQKIRRLVARIRQ
jgi:hypothetical protein